MQQARQGDTVHVHYTGSFEDGTVFDSSRDSEPIEFKIGAGDVIPGFEEAIVGMVAGDQKREVLPADRAYGQRRDDLVFTVDRARIGDAADGIEVGDVLRVGFPGGQTASVQVTGVEGENVTLDANHPLAGRTLVFELELVSIG